MIELESYGDVTRVLATSARSRLVGYSVSAYLVRGAMVDTGFPAVRRAMSALLRARRPRGVLVTHEHEDHAGNVDLVARLGIPLAASDETLAIVREGYRTRLYRRFTWGVMRPLRAGVVPFAPDDLALLPAPGHSPDHHVVWDPRTRTLFGGDLFLGVKVRVVHPHEDPRLLAGTLRAMAALVPRRLFDAHRGPVDDPVGSLLAKADWIDETIAAIERRIVEGWSDRAILREVLGGESLSGWVSRGDYARGNFVRIVRAGLSTGTVPAD